jgi:hypothetical protein
MPITFGIKESSYLCSQIIGGVESAVPLHVDFPRTGGRGFDLPSEHSLREYLKFPYECFFFQPFFRSWVTAVNFVLQTSPEEKITRITSQ